MNVGSAAGLSTVTTDLIDDFEFVVAQHQSISPKMFSYPTNGPTNGHIDFDFKGDLGFQNQRRSIHTMSMWSFSIRYIGELGLD